MRCYKCGNDLPPDSKFCQYCGEDLSKVNFCSFCGSQLQDGMKFCPQCGKGIHTIASTPENIHQEKISLLENPVVSFAGMDIGNVQEPTTITEKEENRCSDKPSVGASLPEETKIEDLTPEEVISASGVDSFAENASVEESATAADTDHAILTSEDSVLAEPSQNSDSNKKKGIITAIVATILVAVIAVVCLLPKNTNNPSVDSEIDFAEIANSVLYLEIYDKNGDVLGCASGFLVNDQTTIVTNYHVIQDAYSLMAWTADEKEAVEINYCLAYDEVADLAILQCESGLTIDPIPLGNSDAVKQGDPVYAIGYPLGLANTLSDGIVSSRYEDEYGNDILQVTAAISEGNSGGPLLNKNGEAIGVMCAYYIYGQNLNIAISSNTLADLIESGYKKTNLNYWVIRPTMPDAEAEIDEIQEPEDQAAEENSEENSPIAQEKTPDVPSSTKGDNKPSPPPSNTKESPTDTIDLSKVKGYINCIDVPDFGSVWGIRASSNEDHGYKDAYKSYMYEYNWSDIGAIKSVCDEIYLELLEQWGFVQRTTEHNEYGVIYNYSTKDRQISISYSNYNNRVCIVITDFRQETDPIEDNSSIPQHEAADTNIAPASAFTFLSNWITNNSNRTLAGDKAYEETIMKDGYNVVYDIIYSTSVNRICASMSVYGNNGNYNTTYLWLAPTGTTFHLDYCYSQLGGHKIFDGAGTINAASTSTFTFSTYEGSADLVNESKDLAVSMCLESLNFVDYIFYTYAVPNGHYFSTVDFGFPS